MTKGKSSIYICQNCGYQTLKWMGRCPDCSQWNCMVEEVEEPSEPGMKEPVFFSISEPENISAISLAPEMRLKTGIAEFDRTLGGGIVPGSMILIGGDPGIGKSTLILQALDRLSCKGFCSLYLSGEESAQQIKLRADRISVHSENLYVVTGTCLEEFTKKIDNQRPDVIAVDSIQTIYTNTIASAPGSVGQVREVASRLMGFAKKTGIPIFLIGHVNKEGAIAGPKVLEHMVDTVLYFEGDMGHLYRIVRSIKNRYGSTNEIGVFEMKDTGLREVGNPSSIFLDERPLNLSGSVVIPCLEGTRPLLVEIQSLVGSSPFGMPRRTSIGIDHNRISLLVAVLAKRIGLELGDQDIFVNVVGGLKVDEPAADLGIVSAMISSFLNRPVDRKLVMFGEVGLAGEIRGVSRAGLRIREAKKLGFSRCLLSKNSLNSLGSQGKMELLGLESIQDLYELLFNPDSILTSVTR
ncbi:MAG: DNA repair protein RadA [Deltaproteobacteria bacterium]|nr:DNA repair protein RadA [Deltaproteobacteria bacterium]